MIVKFCFEKEIHRCSNFPSNLEELKKFLISKFKTSLPLDFELCYTNLEGSTCLLTTNQEFENLVSVQASRPLKVIIVQKNSHIANQSEITSKKESLQNQKEKAFPNPDISFREEVSDIEEKDIKESYSELTEEINDLLEKFSEKPFQKEQISSVYGEQNLMETQIRARVNQALEILIPNLVPQVTAAVKEELFQKKSADAFEQKQSSFLIKPPKEQNYKPKPIPSRISWGYNWNQLAFPYRSNNSQNWLAQNDKINKDSKFLDKVNHNIEESVNITDKQNIGKVQNNNNNQQEEKKIGNEKHNSLTGEFNKRFNKIQTKTMNVLDAFVQKIIGDPYISCSEGRYPKSVLEKSEALKEIFIDESKKVLLEFVNQYEREVTLEQLADLYSNQKNI